MDWDILIRAAGALIGVGGIIYQWITRAPLWRSTLKSDIEIYKMLEKDDPNRVYIQQSISKVVKRRYPYVEKLIDTEEEVVEPPRFKVYSYSSLILGLIFTLGFGYWTFTLVGDGWNWWALLTGFFALGGVGNLLTAFDEPTQRREERRRNQFVSKPDAE